VRGLELGATQRRAARHGLSRDDVDLHREGLIDFPAVRFVPRNPMVERNAPAVVDVPLLDR